MDSVIVFVMLIACVMGPGGSTCHGRVQCLHVYTYICSFGVNFIKLAVVPCGYYYMYKVNILLLGDIRVYLFKLLKALVVLWNTSTHTATVLIQALKSIAT